MNTKKLLTIGISLGLFCLVLMPMMTSALSSDDLFEDVDIEGDTGLSGQSPVQTVVGIINIVLGLLGIAAVIIILIGGMKWMTAGGNEDKVGEAKKWLSRGIAGLIIILAAYGIANFVIEKLLTATGS